MPDAATERPDTRAAALDTALTLFTEKGYFATSVHDIVRASGVSIGSIYHHFGDKAGLARALYEDRLARMEILVANVERHAESCHDQARELVSRLFDLTETEPRAMAFILYARHREFLPDQAPVCSSRPFAMMREMLARGMARGEIRAMDPLVASTCLFGGALRMITSRLDGLLPQPLPTYLDAVWDCGWRAVAAD